MILDRIDWRAHELVPHSFHHYWSRPRGGFPTSLSAIPVSLLAYSAEDALAVPQKGRTHRRMCECVSEGGSWKGLKERETEG